MRLGGGCCEICSKVQALRSYAVAGPTELEDSEILGALDVKNGAWDHSADIRQ